MTIQELKKETGLTQKDIAQFFNMTYGAFANSSAKERYETALCSFYSFLREGEKKKNQDATDVNTSCEP
jgi:transcriptional regulator with XRE-family HTH domain